MRTFYKDEENPYDYEPSQTVSEVKVYRDEEKQPIPSFTVGDVMTEPSTNDINWDGAKATYVGNLDRAQVTGCTASNNLKLSANSARHDSSGSLVKLKEIRISFGGTISVSFALKDLSAGFGGTARIYIGGVAAGVSRNSTTTETLYTETITVNASDLVQIYVQAAGGGDVQVRNMMVSFDRTVDGDGVILTD